MFGPPHSTHVCHDFGESVMHRVLVRRALASAIALSVLTITAACGSDDDPADSAGDDPGTSQSTDAGTDPGTDPGADEEPDAEPPADDVSLPDDVCSLLTAEEVSEAVGVTVTLEAGPSGDCAFGEEDPRGISGLVGVVRDAGSNGGYDAYLSGISATLTDPQLAEISGLGDAATTYVGVPAFGGSTQLMAGGVVDRGDFLEQVTMSQASDLTADQLVPAAEALLRLLDGKLT